MTLTAAQAALKDGVLIAYSNASVDCRTGSFEVNGS